MLQLPKGVWLWYQRKAYDEGTNVGRLLIGVAVQYAADHGFVCVHPKEMWRKDHDEVVSWAPATERFLKPTKMPIMKCLSCGKFVLVTPVGQVSLWTPLEVVAA